MDKLIKHTLTWLTFRNEKLRATALEVARSLLPYGTLLTSFILLVLNPFPEEYRSILQANSMAIVGLLGDQYASVRGACVELLCSPNIDGKSYYHNPITPLSHLVKTYLVLNSKISFHG